MWILRHPISTSPRCMPSIYWKRPLSRTDVSCSLTYPLSERRPNPRVRQSPLVAVCHAAWVTARQRRMSGRFYSRKTPRKGRAIQSSCPGFKVAPNGRSDGRRRICWHCRHTLLKVERVSRRQGGTSGEASKTIAAAIRLRVRPASAARPGEITNDRFAPQATAP